MSTINLGVLIEHNNQLGCQWRHGVASVASCQAGFGVAVGKSPECLALLGVGSLWRPEGSHYFVWEASGADVACTTWGGQPLALRWQPLALRWLMALRWLTLLSSLWRWGPFAAAFAGLLIGLCKRGALVLPIRAEVCGSC